MGYTENGGFSSDEMYAQYRQAVLAGDTATAAQLLGQIDPSSYRDVILGGVRGGISELYAMTENNIALLASKVTDAEGNIFVKATGKPSVLMGGGEFAPMKSSYVIRSYGPEEIRRYKQVVLDVSTQKLLREAGISTLNGTAIPANPTEPLETGDHTMAPNINDSGIFTEWKTKDNTDASRDKRYQVTTRVPDSYSYHWEFNDRKRYTEIPIEERGHAQYSWPMAMTDQTFERELAKARYLTGMEPYLSPTAAKQFDHFTYWKYKTPNPNNAFAGAYIHIFLSRPDLHIFDRFYERGGKLIRSDIGNSPDLATLVYMYPESALSLVGRWQSKAMTDINLFLSNRACGISLANDQIDDHNFVEAFNKIKPTFGGRMDNSEGDIDITFNETQDLAVSNTILLWMKYIHATYTGQLSALMDSTTAPTSFERNITYHHPMWRKLDSLASIYVIATDMTQRNIIFWRKYFGVYPKSTAFAGLSATGEGKIVEGVRKIQIPFRYVTFRTNNLIDLFAFNKLSDLDHVLRHTDYALLNNVYQTRDPNVSNDHDVIAGLPFIAVDQSYGSTLPEYNRVLPTQLYKPELLFAKTDGAFIPDNDQQFNDEFVARYWAGHSASR